jgi:hypothetical protein
MWARTHQIYFLNEFCNDNMGATNSVIFSPFFLFFNIILLLCIIVLFNTIIIIIIIINLLQKKFPFPP